MKYTGFGVCGSLLPQLSHQRCCRAWMLAHGFGLSGYTKSNSWKSTETHCCKGGLHWSMHCPVRALGQSAFGVTQELQSSAGPGRSRVLTCDICTCKRRKNMSNVVRISSDHAYWPLDRRLSSCKIPLPCLNSCTALAILPCSAYMTSISICYLKPRRLEQACSHHSPVAVTRSTSA